ncbi:MAG TPA: 2-hydroxychromene-2-carboxylate isomerase [Bacteriovoracaceae bacterium]|nr:2-hydroxychromene-2-carboxylate isomerase [Bacteriovoracaceae bacterium]
MKKITFYFDFLSPFSYFAWADLHHSGLQIDYKPVALGPLLNQWGIKGPGEVTPKREFLLKQCLRYAAEKKMPFTTPKTHPFNSLYALRLALKSTAGDLQGQVIACLWKAGWQDRIDMGEPDELLAALKGQGLPAEELYEKSFTREAKQELKANIQEAVGYGVFGVPSFVAQGELFWGKDSIPDLLRFIQGNDLLDRSKLEMLLASTPRAAAQQIT